MAPLRSGPPVVLVAGSASRDVTVDDARGWRLGGAVTYASLTLARLGFAVRAVVGADGPASEARELDELRSAGVDLEIVHLRRGPVFENIERAEGRVQRCLEVSDSLSPDRVPDPWRDADGVFLGPVAGELDPSWASLGAGRAQVVFGWQGLLRHLVAGKDVARLAPRPHALLQRADLIGVSTDDLGPDARLRDLVDLVEPGATLVVTRGDRGGTVLTSRRPGRSILRAYPAIPSDAVVDATGAGDVFLATLFAATIDGERLAARGWAEALTLAAAAASLVVEAPGLSGVATLDAVRRRAAESA